jgi:multidrug efflux pump subunit AcrA (membrane-fusion protein)
MNRFTALRKRADNSMSPIRKVHIAAAGFALAAGIFGITLTGCNKPVKAVEIKPVAKPVSVVEPQTGRLRPAIEFTGSITPINEVDIYSKIGGRVAQVMVKEGDEVTEGQTLIQIEDDEINAQIHQIEASIASARAQLSKARTGFDLQDTQTAVSINQSIQNNLQSVFNAESAKLSLNNARADRDRFRRLFDRGAISKQSLESYELRYDTLKKQYDTAQSLIKVSQEAMKLARANTAMTSIKKDDITLAQTQIDGLEAQLELAKINLRNCRITAPIRGVITLKKVDKGEIVTSMPSGNPLLKIVDNSLVSFEGEVGEGRIEEIKPGGEVELKMDSFPGKVFNGSVETVIAAADSKTRAFRVKVSVPNGSGDLMSGMFGRGAYMLQAVEGLIVPRQVLIKGIESDSALAEKELTGGPKTDGGTTTKTEYSVFTVNGSKAKKVGVSIGVITENQALITKGLEKGSKVISLGLEDLQENDDVEITRGK